MRPFILLLLAAALLPLSPARAEDSAAVYIISHIEVAPASKNQSATLLREFAAASRKETGALRFEVLQRTAPSHHFLVLEIWKDQQAFDAHAARTAEFRTKLKPLLMAPVDDRPCIAIDVAPLPQAHTRGALFVVSHIDVPPTAREQIVGPLKSSAETSRKENGNERFDVVQQKARANHFFTFEVWKDQKAADAHELTAQMKQFRATLVPLTGALYDRRWYKAL